MYQVTRKYPSVTCGDSSAQGTPFGCPKGEPIHKLANAVSSKVDHLQKQHFKEPTLQIQASATTGVGKPQADSECNERISPDGFDAAAPENCFPRASPRGDVGIASYTFQEILP